jgi:hypothetical protein
MALGYSKQDFLDAYGANLAAQTLEAVEGNLVGAASLELMRSWEAWTGTPTELLVALESVAENARLIRRTASGKVEGKGWPGSPHILTRRINEIQSNLLDLGIEVVHRHGDERTVQLRRLDTREPESSVGTVGSHEETPREQVADATDAGSASAEEWEVTI